MAVDFQKVSQMAVHHLRRSSDPRVRAVSCECDRGAVLLRGRVQCYYHKQLAQEMVRKLEGVDQVVNEIKVVDLLR